MPKSALAKEKEKICNYARRYMFPTDADIEVVDSLFTIQRQFKFSDKFLAFLMDVFDTKLISMDFVGIKIPKINKNVKQVLTERLLEVCKNIEKAQRKRGTT